jgi:hypothetical protein
MLLCTGSKKVGIPSLAAGLAGITSLQCRTVATAPPRCRFKRRRQADRGRCDGKNIEEIPPFSCAAPLASRRDTVPIGQPTSKTSCTNRNSLPWKMRSEWDRHHRAGFHFVGSAPAADPIFRLRIHRQEAYATLRRTEFPRILAASIGHLSASYFRIRVFRLFVTLGK